VSNSAKRKEALSSALGKVHAQVRSTSERIEAQRAANASRTASRGQWVTALNLLTSRTANVCNDMLATRDADPWSTAFAYVVQYCLTNLAAAKYAESLDAQVGMAVNLSLIAEELYAAFPSGKRVVTDWKTAVGDIRKLLPAGNPATLSDVHPFAATLGRQLSILKNRGYPMPGLTEFYAPSDQGLHILRPT